MEALVVYESMFGNGRQVAQAIGHGLQRHFPTDIVEVGEAPTRIGPEVGLVIAGGPNHAFGLSRADTRREAATYTDEDLVSTGRALRDWLDEVEASDGDAVAAAYDTRIWRPRIVGLLDHGASTIERALRRRGFRVIAAPKHFHVTERTGPLVDGEVERADKWGEELAKAVLTRLTT